MPISSRGSTRRRSTASSAPCPPAARRPSASDGCGSSRPTGTAGGSLCREFTVAGQAGDAEAVACRAHDARPVDSWTLAFAQTDPIPQAGAAPKVPAEKAPSYAPADGNSLVDTYLQGVGAGDPLDAGAEQKALGR